MKLGFGLLGILAFVSSSQQIYTPDIWLSIHRWQTSTIRFWKSKQKSMNTMMSTSPKRPRRRARMMTGLGWSELGQSLVISRRRLSLWPSTLWGMTKPWQIVDNLHPAAPRASRPHPAPALFWPRRSFCPRPTVRSTFLWWEVLSTRAWNGRFAKISQSRRRPLLGPSLGWKFLLALPHLRH